MTENERRELLELRKLLAQCRPILHLSGVAMSAQAGHMAGLGIDSLADLEALRSRVDKALNGPSRSDSGAERDPLVDPMPGDVIRHTSVDIGNMKTTTDDFVVVRRYVDSLNQPMVEWAAPADKNPREAHVDAMTLDEWREGPWSGGVVRVAGGAACLGS